MNHTEPKLVGYLWFGSRLPEFIEKYYLQYLNNTKTENLSQLHYKYIKVIQEQQTKISFIV